MKISLVMTVKDEAASAPELIRDIRAQTTQPDEWIVVDGGSTDATVDLFSRAQNCTVVEYPGTIAEGRNRGIEMATGEIIVMTDAGCRLPPQWLAHVTTPLLDQQTHKPIDIVGGRFDARLQGSFDAVQWTLLDQLNFSSTRQRSPRFSCRSLAILRRVWEACPFPGWLAYGEDAWAQIEWDKQGFRSCAIESPVVSWHMRPNIAQFFAQHFRYAKGDGEARMRTRTHCARLAFYAALLLLVLGHFGLHLGFALLGALLMSVGYLALNGLRLVQVLHRRQRLTWLPTSLMLLTPMLALLDLAKVLGYLVGLSKGGSQLSNRTPASAPQP